MKKSFICALMCLALLGSGCTTEIQPGEVGVTTDWGKLTGWYYTSGYHFTGPGIDVHILNTQVQAIDYSGESVLSVLSRDRLPIGVEITVQWQLNPGTAPQVYESFRDEIDSRLITPTAREAVRDVMSHYDAEAAVQHRDRLGNEMSQRLSAGLVSVLTNSNMPTYAVRIVGIQVRNIHLPAQIQESIQRIQHARNGAQEREQQVRVAQQEAARAAAEAEGAARVSQIRAEQEAAVRAINAQSEADAVRVRAAADAEANELINRSLSPNLLRLQEIRAQQTLAGHVQTVILGGNAQTVLPVPMPGR